MDKLWYCTENYRTLIYTRKNYEKNFGTILNNGSFQTTIAIYLWFTISETMVLWKIQKTMKLWFTMGETMVLWKKLWYFGKNDGTMEITMVLWKEL